jgi:hypothetical protein
MRTAANARIDYRVADVMRADTLGTYDAVVSVNMVHHLPLEGILPRLSALVAPDGVLVIQDVVTRAGIRYLPINVLAGVVTRGRRLLRRDGEPRNVRELYDEHGRGETYLAPHAVRDALESYLAGVRVIHHLGWRYTAIWSRAAAT